MLLALYRPGATHRVAVLAGAADRRVSKLSFLTPSAVRAMQAIWVAALAVALPVALHRRWLMIPHAHVEVLAGAAAIGSVIAELFMIKSLVVFDPKISTDVATNGHEPASPRYSRGRVSVCLPSLHLN